MCKHVYVTVIHVFLFFLIHSLKPSPRTSADCLTDRNNVSLVLVASTLYININLIDPPVMLKNKVPPIDMCVFSYIFTLMITKCLQSEDFFLAGIFLNSCYPLRCVLKGRCVDLVVKLHIATH